ncbi:hypothetical protein MB901379_02782 [Mycobacterium basiliense]|uniref:Uncharacterized protein n=1 Tax=Mycobacterium basiliense TaxID=2094119 RepID=A0A3S5CZU8_9MYCO|nr:hypothetical protein MB901379_02782 [Mycobacterium basiliense]
MRVAISTAYARVRDLSGEAGAANHAATAPDSQPSPNLGLAAIEYPRHSRRFVEPP